MCRCYVIKFHTNKPLHNNKYLCLLKRKRIETTLRTTKKDALT